MSAPEPTLDACIVCRKRVGLSHAELALRHLYIVREHIRQEIAEIDLTINCLTRFAHVEITDAES